MESPDQELVDQLEAQVAEARRNGLVSALGVMLLAPLMLAGAVFGLFFILGNTLPDLMNMLSPGGFAALVLLLFVLLAVAGWEYDRRQDFTRFHPTPGLNRDGSDFSMDMGFAMLFPGLILESFAMVFTSTWLWRGLSRDEVLAAAELLQLLAVGNQLDLETVRTRYGRDKSKRVIQALRAMAFIRRDKGQLFITVEGRDFLVEG